MSPGSKVPDVYGYLSMFLLSPKDMQGSHMRRVVGTWVVTRNDDDPASAHLLGVPPYVYVYKRILSRYVYVYIYICMQYHAHTHIYMLLLHIYRYNFMGTLAAHILFPLLRLHI